MIPSLRLCFCGVRQGREDTLVKDLYFKVLWKFGVKYITKFSKCRPSELDSSGDLHSLTVILLIE